ncbi:MAG: hypothetical protein IJK45_04250 [Bacteroidaceae bacterium]|nr:hypothetical protein [Bacteroidaceae bacterium]
MKKISLLLTMLLLSVSIGASTGTFTTDDGISYRKEFVDGHPIYEIYRIDNSATTLTIPHLGLESSVVVQFSNEIYGSCPNLTDLYVSTGTTLYTQTGRIPNGIFNGRFANCMPNLKRIHFTGNIWEPGNATFAQDIDVYVKHLYDYDSNSWWGYQSNEDIILAWGNHSQVKNVYCEDEESYLYYKYSLTSSKSASIFGFYSPDAFSIRIPEYITTDNGTIYFNRLGYSGITTTFNCPNDTLLTLGNTFKIDQYSHMEGFPALKKLVFNKHAVLTGADFSSNPLTTVEFHGTVTLGTGFKNVATLTKVYFYDETPSLSGSPGDYFYNNARGITFYMNLDKWQIAELKETNPLWSNLDIQCIDPSLNYSKVRVVNLGPATFKLQGLLNENGVTYTIKPNRNNVWYTFDKHCLLYYDYTSLEENSDEMSVSGIVLNDTQNMIYDNTHFARLTALQNTLKVSYLMRDIPLGSTWDIQFTKIGDGHVFFSYDNDWNMLDPEESTRFDIYDMEHDGEVYNYTFTNYDQDNIIYFSAYCDKPHDGIVHTVRVLANNIPVEPSRIDEDDDDDEIKYSYAISIVGDMDIEIINEDNGRNLSIVNGMGGTIDLCREESTLLSTIDNGTDFTGRYANTANLYAVIKPDEGKVVNAIYLNDERHSPDEFMEGDSYVVPITGFADGEGTYHMNVVYADKEHMIFDISAVGDGKVDIFMMGPDDGQTVTTLRSATASEALGRHQQVPLYYDEINNDDDDHKTYVEYRVLKPKDGEKVTILWNGNDVTEQFTLTSNGTELRQRLVPSLSETDLGLLQSSTLTAIYEQEESADIIEWNLLMVGDVDVANNENPKTNAIWVVGGDELLSVSEGASLKATCNIDKTWYQPTDTYLGFYINVKPGQTFKASFNGTDVTDIFVRNANYDNDDGTLCYIYEVRGYEQFATSGTWVVEVKNADLLTQHIQLTGEQLGYFHILYLNSGGRVFDEVVADNAHQYVTFSSDEKEYIKSLKIYVDVPQGYTFKAYFNGQEVTGFTLDNSYYVVTLDESFITDGTWVVEFKKGITWTAVATGDVAEGMLDSGVESGVEIELNNQDDLELVEVMLSPSNTHNTGFFNFGVSDGDITPTGMHAWIYCKPRYELSSVTFNGVEYIQRFNKNTSGVNPLYTLSLDIDDDLSPFLVDGTWVVEFKKAGISWDGLIIGDVPQGATVQLGLDGMTLEVFLNANEKSGSDIYPGDATGVGMEAAINAPAGYNFKVWFNGEEKTDKFDKNGYYSIPFDNPTEVAPYLQDGQWIILFYDDLERYDVNRDGQISIADVTTLVNKILGKE